MRTIYGSPVILLGRNRDTLVCRRLEDHKVLFAEPDQLVPQDGLDVAALASPPELDDDAVTMALEVER